MGIGTKLVSISIVFVLVLTGCCVYNTAGDDDVIILFTGDVHCAYDMNLGYDGVSAYKQDMEKEYRNVMLVDTGDFIQGDVAGIMSKGEFMTDFMELVGYDLVTLGNHEFDYGADRLWELLRDASFGTVCCNVTYTGDKEDPMDFVQSFMIKEFGNVRIGFIGVTTPITTKSTAPANLMEDGKTVYDFSGQDSGKRLYSSVQRSIDCCKEAGATHIVLLSHLGDSECPPYTSVDVIKNTSGLTCVLDGHQHSVIREMKVTDRDGHEVSISSTGTRLNNIGCLRISQTDGISLDLVNCSDYTKKDPKVTEHKEALNRTLDMMLGSVVFTLPVDLPILDGNGARMVRNQETAIGNMIADAFRTENDTDIGLFTGGGIKKSLSKGDVTYYDILRVMPYMNSASVAEVTGQTILDALEMSCRKMTENTSSGPIALGESGGFMSVSGLRFNVDTSIETPVIVDENDSYVGMKDAPRRVSDVMVLDRNTGGYVDIDPDATYSVSGTDYLLIQYGDGYTMFRDADVIYSSTALDITTVIQYMKGLSQERIADLYSGTDGRITRI